MPYDIIETNGQAAEAADQIAKLKRYRRFMDTLLAAAKKDEASGELFDEVADEIANSHSNVTYTIDGEIERLDEKLRLWEEENLYSRPRLLSPIISYAGSAV